MRYDGEFDVQMPPVSVTVGSSDITDFRIVRPALITVPGILRILGDGEVRRLYFTLTSIPDARTVQASAAVVSNETFRLSVPEGQFRLGLNPPTDGYTVRSITYGSVNMLAAPFVIAPGYPPALELVLEYGVGCSMLTTGPGKRC
jgi:hypothetical protein